MKYALKTPSSVDAFTVAEETPDFHGVKLVLLDDGTVKLANTADAGTAVGDYFVVPGSAPSLFAAKADFEREYAPAPLSA